VTAKTSNRRHGRSRARRESPRRRHVRLVWLVVFFLGLAHGWLHLANTDQHGHFAHHGDECCLVQNLGGATAPPVIEVPLPQFVALRFYIIPAAPEACGLPPSIGYSPRDPPLA